ncbi:uncharacterized protein LOC62_01G001049 [Vanrija pseudolonga]|uniref:Uncharacterized protein n=1 Tax=Vanrija pseudolonga TaxID=143232 RepID=A0AAF0Y0D7_9TREE|nr:hypothetical protein LOC62_01G001049 [Vanrija pseudolonga]
MKLGQFLVSLRWHPYLTGVLLTTINDSEAYRTDDMRLQAFVSLILSYLDAWMAQLQQADSYTVESYLSKLYEFIPRTDLYKPIMRAVVNALVYGALALFMSDKYETKAWRNSKWEFALEAAGGIIGTAAGASAVPGVGSSVSGVIRVGNSVISQKLRQGEDSLRKVVVGVARKFGLHILREAEEGRLRDERGQPTTKTDGRRYNQAELDDYIRTASMVFNIIVAETKVPLSVNVTARSTGGALAEQAVKLAQDTIELVKGNNTQRSEPVLPPSNGDIDSPDNMTSSVPPPPPNPPTDGVTSAPDVADDFSLDGPEWAFEL